uniref:Uncharacterized protein n=1 Tax=viral metagenome TaxID=1070528 RepID=A0A6H1ZXP5_9ZZZZ
MVLWGWIVKLFSGFLPVDGKRIGKIIWVLVICACAIGIYHKTFVARTESTVIQRGATQIINQCKEENGVFGIRLNLWKLSLRFGL